MSVARITKIKFKSKEGCDDVSDSYTENAPSEFPEAEQLLQLKIDGTTMMAVSIYKDEETMERANAARNNRMNTKKDYFESVETSIGFVKLNHSN